MVGHSLEYKTQLHNHGRYAAPLTTTEVNTPSDHHFANSKAEQIISHRQRKATKNTQSFGEPNC